MKIRLPKIILSKKEIWAFCIFYPFIFILLIDILYVRHHRPNIFSHHPFLFWLLCLGPGVVAIHMRSGGSFLTKWLDSFLIGIVYVIAMAAPVIWFSLLATCSLGIDCI